MLTRSALISRAREKGVGDGKPTVAARVDFVTDLMEELLWDSRYHPWLAELWSLSEASVHAHAAEASRRVMGDAESARRDITAGARKLYRRAVEEEKPRDARAIGELWAMVAGAKAPEKHEVTMDNKATPAAAAALIREHFGGHAMKDDETRDAGPSEAEAVPEVPSGS